MKKKILVLGASGMAGHVIHLYLTNNGYSSVGIARHFPKELPNTARLDARDLLDLRQFIERGAFDVIVNCIGILNATAERDKENAVFINSYLPHWLATLEPKLIHLSTDCVFSGDSGNYCDEAAPDGRTFYDRTKALGEVVNLKDLTLRQSIVGPELSPNGIGLLNWFLLQNGPISGYKNAIWNGITTLELAKGILFSIAHNRTGLHQMVHTQPVSKFELLKEFRNTFGRHSLKIEPFENQPSLNKSLKSTRNDFGFSVSPYPQQLEELRRWMIDHPDLYAHYNIP